MSVFKRTTQVFLLALFGCAATQPPLSAPACSAPLGVPVANACVVAPGVLWRGGKPDAAAATALVALHVRTVVNLELLHSDLHAFTDSSPTLTADTEIGYFRVRD